MKPEGKLTKAQRITNKVEALVSQAEKLIHNQPNLDYRSFNQHRSIVESCGKIIEFFK